MDISRSDIWNVLKVFEGDLTFLGHSFDRGNACFGGASEFKVLNVNGSLCNLCALALGLALSYTSSTYSAHKFQEGLNSCPLLRYPALAVLVMFGVSKRLPGVVSALQPAKSTDQIGYFQVFPRHTYRYLRASERIT